MFCRHEWELVDKEVLPSEFEQLAKYASKVRGNGISFQKKYISIFQCAKCKKLEKFVEVNP